MCNYTRPFPHNSEFAIWHVVQNGNLKGQKNTIWVLCWISHSGGILHGIHVAVVYYVTNRKLTTVHSYPAWYIIHCRRSSINTSVVLGTTKCQKQTNKQTNKYKHKQTNKQNKTKQKMPKVVDKILKCWKCVFFFALDKHHAGRTANQS